MSQKTAVFRAILTPGPVPREGSFRVSGESLESSVYNEASGG
jgi:hypothetical protein